MNRNKESLILRAGRLLFIMGVSLMFTVSAFSQTSPTDGVSDGATDPDDPVPFDGGISLLVAAGVAYGAKRWHEARKSNTEKEDVSEV